MGEEEDGRTGGGRRRKADTELKTKTPHVNVGKKRQFENSYHSDDGMTISHIPYFDHGTYVFFFFLKV